MDKNRIGDARIERARPVGSARARRLAVCFGPALLLTVAWAATPAQTDDDLFEARSTSAQWVETEHAISKEKLEWTMKREYLEDLIAMRRDEIEEYRQKIVETREKIGTAEAEIDKMLAESETLEATAAELEDTVRSLEAAALQLVSKLPPVARERVELLEQSIPDDPDDTNLTLGKRFLNIVGIVDQLNKFHAEISTANERRDQPDGTTVEVMTAYVGLSMAFYANASGDVAGSGRFVNGQWVWEAHNEDAAEIARLIAILDGESAEFVSLPVSLR